MIRLYKFPKWSKWLYPGAIWDFSFKKENAIYLTFDDGPNPDSTPWLINFLKEHDVSATFFCLGKQVEKHPKLYRNLIENGHQIGNHGYLHLNGLTVTTSKYMNNISKATEFIDSNLFRPPYGKITLRQYKRVKKLNLKLVFWSLMPYDFDQDFDSKKRIELMKKKVTSGSIVVFHDSPNSSIKNDLPEMIDYWKKKNLKFNVIPN